MDRERTDHPKNDFFTDRTLDQYLEIDLFIDQQTDLKSISAPVDLYINHTDFGGVASRRSFHLTNKLSSGRRNQVTKCIQAASRVHLVSFLFRRFYVFILNILTEILHLIRPLTHTNNNT